MNYKTILKYIAGTKEEQENDPNIAKGKNSLITGLYLLSSIPTVLLKPSIGIPMSIDATIKGYKAIIKEDYPVGVIGSIRSKIKRKHLLPIASAYIAGNIAGYALWHNDYNKNFSDSGLTKQEYRQSFDPYMNNLPMKVLLPGMVISYNNQFKAKKKPQEKPKNYI